MRQRIAYPGIAGSFSYGAARDAFPGAELIGFEAFRDAAEAALRQADYALLPIENSFAGAVQSTYALLDSMLLHIVGEAARPVRHQLLGLPGATLPGIRRITSHPQALAQCDAFLSALKNVQLLPSPNTAISARQVSESCDPALAAIASTEAAEAYGLQVLAQDIQTARNNTTRFVILSRRPEPIDLPNKATVVFRLNHEVGALARVLLCFAKSGLNLTRIESRPLPETPFQYFFSADFEGVGDPAVLHAAIRDAEPYTASLRLLGLYRKAVC
ncbi:MAG: bifunctional chorismate mutase/prephenate dehydratase [Clostridia bacterium]|nr:bifunctional chorismate mutase/prephenate dehydratase [Clostridia bacterium]